MGEWKNSTLSEVSEDISYGFTESATADPIGPKFLRITDIANGRINWDAVPHCPISDVDREKYRLSPGDIVIARTGASTGANFIMTSSDPKDVVYASYLIRYRIERTQAEPCFVGYCLQSPSWRSYVAGVSGGSAQPGANAKLLGGFEFLLPGLHEQRAIASVLGSLDAKIDLLHRQNKTLEAMAEALFREWFVERRPEGVGGEGWEGYILTDIADHCKKSVKPVNHPNRMYHHYSLPAYDMGRKPSPELGSSIKSSKYVVPGNAVLVSKLNPRFPRVWPILTQQYEHPISSTEFQVFVPKQAEMFGFLYCFVSSKAVQDELASAASGTSGSHQRVRPDDIKLLSFEAKSKQQLVDFSKTVAPLLEKVEMNKDQIINLANLRDTLLPKLMSGEVRVEKDRTGKE